MKKKLNFFWLDVFAILHHIIQLIISTIEATSQAIWSKSGI